MYMYIPTMTLLDDNDPRVTRIGVDMKPITGKSRSKSKSVTTTTCNSKVRIWF